MQNSINLGDKVRDKINGVEGIVIGRTEWLTGCDTLTVEPVADKDGKKQDWHYADWTRFDVVKRAAVKIEASTPDTIGGPQPHGAPSRRVH